MELIFVCGEQMRLPTHLGLLEQLLCLDIVHCGCEQGFLWDPTKHIHPRLGMVQFQMHLFFRILDDELWGHAVVQLVDALRYKPEGRGFNSRWCHWNFLLT
jgi:hypothetical protein